MLQAPPPAAAAAAGIGHKKCVDYYKCTTHIEQKSKIQCIYVNIYKKKCCGKNYGFQIKRVTVTQFTPHMMFGMY